MQRLPQPPATAVLMQRGMAGAWSNLRESEMGYPDTRDAGVLHAQIHFSRLSDLLGRCVTVSRALRAAAAA